jgi:hypothetical protein
VEEEAEEAEAEEAEAEEKIRLKQCLPSFEGEIYRFLFNFNKLNF